MATMEQQSALTPTVKDYADEVEISLILFSSDGRVWLGRDCEGMRSFPRIWIPKWTRVAQEVVKAAANHLGMEIFCLWEIRELDARYVVARVKNPEAVGIDLVGVSPQGLSDVRQNEDMLRLALLAHGDAFSRSQSSSNEPFKSINWDFVLQERLLATLEEKGIELTGHAQQFNASETFALMKLETSGSPLWFKAVGEPNLAEYSITLGVHHLFPGVMPSIVAEFPELHGWITEDARGKRLDSSTKLEDWKRAAVHLADLQVASLQYVDDLFRAGCTDCRTYALVDHLGLFVEAMQRAMADDQDLNTVRLNRKQIDEVADAVSEAVAGIVTLGVPDALVHRDLSGGNIQISTDSCYFIDWAQACIGLPFICSEYMKVHFSVAIGDQPNSELQVAELSDAYASRWIKVLTTEQIRVARKHAPILAEYLYVTPIDGRTALDLLGTRENRAMMRSMVRRMWREMQVYSTNDFHMSETHHA
jgi:hypothetical protein